MPVPLLILFLLFYKRYTTLKNVIPDQFFFYSLLLCCFSFQIFKVYFYIRNGHRTKKKTAQNAARRCVFFTSFKMRNIKGSIRERNEKLKLENLTVVVSIRSITFLFVNRFHNLIKDFSCLLIKFRNILFACLIIAK